MILAGATEHGNGDPTVLYPVVQLLDGVLGSTEDEDDVGGNFTDKWVPASVFPNPNTNVDKHYPKPNP